MIIIDTYPTIIEILGDGLSLLENDLNLEILRVIAKMVLQSKDSKTENLQGINI